MVEEACHVASDCGEGDRPVEDFVPVAGIPHHVHGDEDVHLQVGGPHDHIVKVPKTVIIEMHP